MKTSSVPSVISAFMPNRLTQAFTFLTWSIFKSSSLSWSLPLSHLSTFCCLKCVPPQNHGIPKPQPFHSRAYSSSCTAKTIVSWWPRDHISTSSKLPAVSLPLAPAELSLPQCMLRVFNARDWACLVYIPSCLKESLLKGGLRAAGEPPLQERFELGEGKSSANEEPASSTMLCSWDYSEPCFPELNLWGVDFSAQTHLCSAWTR